MRYIGTFDAKTHLSSLINDVENGARITITKRNLPVALLIPIDQDVRSNGSATVEQIQPLRKNLRGRMSLEELLRHRDEGRK